MISAKPAHNEFVNRFQFKANDNIIKNKNHIKIFGITLQNNLYMSTQVGKICAKL